MSADIEHQVFELIRNTCNYDGSAGILTSDTKLADLGVDSMKVIEVAYQLEKRFAFEVKEDALAQLRTIGCLVQMVKASVVPRVS